MLKSQVSIPLAVDIDPDLILAASGFFSALLVGLAVLIVGIIVVLVVAPMIDDWLAQRNSPVERIARRMLDRRHFGGV